MAEASGDPLPLVKMLLPCFAMPCRCAAADLSNAYLVQSAGNEPQNYLNVSYLMLAGSEAQQCSGYLAGDVSWSAQPRNGSDNSSSVPVWSGGSPGNGWSCPVQQDELSAPFGMFCAFYGNPNDGMTSFDNIIWAWAAIFQCITTEGWTDIMYALQVSAVCSCIQGSRLYASWLKQACCFTCTLLAQRCPP